MRILIIVCHRKHIAFSPQSMPIEISIGISEHVWKVRHTFFIGNVRNRAALSSRHIITDIHLSEVPSQTEPFGKTIPDRDIKSLCGNLSIIYISGG